MASLLYGTFRSALDWIICITIYPLALFVVVKSVYATVSEVFPIEFAGLQYPTAFMYLISGMVFPFSRSVTSRFVINSHKLRLSSYLFDEQVPGEEVSKYANQVHLFRQLSLSLPRRVSRSSCPDGADASASLGAPPDGSLQSVDMASIPGQEHPNQGFRDGYIPHYFTIQITVVCALIWIYQCLQVFEALASSIPLHIRLTANFSGCHL